MALLEHDTSYLDPSKWEPFENYQDIQQPDKEWLIKGTLSGDVIDMKDSSQFEAEVEKLVENQRTNGWWWPCPGPLYREVAK